MKCKIENITELDGITQKPSHAQRVGRVGNILTICIGYPMWIEYNDGHGTLMTSTIEDIKENPQKFMVKTHNAIYLLAKL